MLQTYNTKKQKQLHCICLKQGLNCFLIDPNKGTFNKEDIAANKNIGRTEYNNKPYNPNDINKDDIVQDYVNSYDKDDNDDSNSSDNNNNDDSNDENHKIEMYPICNNVTPQSEKTNTPCVTTLLKIKHYLKYNLCGMSLCLMCIKNLIYFILYHCEVTF